MRIEKFTGFNVYVMTEKQLEEKDFSNGYKYIVYKGSYNHEAFKTFEGLCHWANIHGLTIPSDMEDGNLYNIEGVFFEACLFEIEPFLPDSSNVYTLKCWDESMFDEFGKRNKLTPYFITNNGSYTRSYIYKGFASGKDYGAIFENVTVIYYLNPNCKQYYYDYRMVNDGIPNNPQVIGESK